MYRQYINADKLKVRIAEALRDPNSINVCHRIICEMQTAPKDPRINPERQVCENRQHWEHYPAKMFGKCRLKQPKRRMYTYRDGTKVMLNTSCDTLRRDTCKRWEGTYEFLSKKKTE